MYFKKVLDLDRYTYWISYIYVHVNEISLCFFLLWLLIINIRTSENMKNPVSLGK